MLQKGYFDRQYTAYPNGHATVGSMEVKYDAYQGAADRVLSFPGMPTTAGRWSICFRERPTTSAARRYVLTP